MGRSENYTGNDASTIACFLYEHIFTRYGLPIEIVIDKGAHLINKGIHYLLDELMVIHLKSTPYHPQANGQAQSSNKILCTVLTNIVESSRIDWDLKFYLALSAYQVSYKTVFGMTPFNMVYDLDAILSIKCLITTLRTAQQPNWAGHEFFERILELE